MPKNSKGERSVCNRKDQEWERLTDFAYCRPLRWEPDKFPSHMPSDITSSGSLGKAMGLKVKSKRRADGQRVFRVRP